MVFDLIDPGGADNGEPFSAPQCIPVERLSSVSLLVKPPCSEMSLTMLTAQCLRELDTYRRGEPCADTCGVELFRRAIIQTDPEARACIQHCFGGIVRELLRHHPKRKAACQVENEEHYIAQAFECFWQATMLTQHVKFTTLADALQYLRASLNGAILDTLRTYARSREVSLPEPDKPGEPYMEEMTSSSEVWELLQTMLPNGREQRLAYLLYLCELKPREIIRFCSQEWSDVQEIYRLRRNILERLLRNSDQLHWRFNRQERL